MVNMREITGQISTGHEFESSEISSIKQAGFNAVIDLRAEASDNEELIKSAGMDFFHTNIVDHENPTFGQLNEMCAFCEPLLAEGKKLLIHCRAGTGRAPMAAMVILAHNGMSLEKAMILVERKHQNIGFSEVQLRFIFSELPKYFMGESQ